MTPKRKSLPRSLLSKCLLFLVFLSLNGFLPVVLIFILRRAVPHRSVPVRSVPRPRPQTLVNPVVSLSGRIEAALLAKDHQSFSELISTAPPAALYSYTPASFGRHFVHLALWDPIALDALQRSHKIDLNRNCILHAAVKLLDANNFLHTEYIEALISHGADINLPDSSGYPALAYAVQRDNLPATRFLLSRGANVNISFFSYSSILHYAVATRSSPSLISLLITNRGNPFHRGKDGLTPFHHSIFLETSDRIDIINAFIHTPHPIFTDDPVSYRSLLLNYPINPRPVPSPSSQTCPGYTPLHLAVEKVRSCAMVRILSENGADRNKRENNGLTPLQLAENIQQFDIIRILRG